MRAVAAGQDDQARAVEVDSTVVHIVRVLFGVDAAGTKPDLPLLFVHAIHSTDDPVSLRDLILDITGSRVDQVEMVPTVSLGHPDNFVRRVDELAVLLVGIIKECFAHFIDQRGSFARVRIDGNDPHHLMSTLVVDERQPSRIGLPANLPN